VDSQPIGLVDLQHRLAKVETQNRRLKQLGVAALIILTLFLVMGQAPTKKAVEANEFVLKDDTGKVRIRLCMQDPDFSGGAAFPKMVFLDTKGNTSLEFDGSIPGLSREGADLGGTVQISDVQGHRVSALLADDSGGHFWVAKWKEDAAAWVNPGSVEAGDDNGFLAAVGVEDLVAPTPGQTHKTSAASVVLFDKNKNVIWKAP
jgi:hypothetical protein